MMPAADRVKVVDFGLAKLAGAAASTFETTSPLTVEGTIVGTAPYMSPEQATGRAVDARSDLFSLGTILYEMLAGHAPFRADSAVGTIAAILKDQPAPIPGIPSAAAKLLDRCLRKDPADRFQSAAEMQAAIVECLAPPRSAGKPSVAVLPFTNMSGVKEDDYLCDGLAEETIDALTRIPGLRVIARTSAFAVGRMGLDVREAGARLDVTTILEGSVRRAGSRVRVTAQLVSTADGSHVWSERYDRELTDVLALEDEIAQAIATRLRVELGDAPRTPTAAVVNPDAYTAYLEGRHHFARGTPDGLMRALACYERATALDPGFALAYDSLAELHWYLGFFGHVAPRDAFAVSTFNAVRALELDDGLAQTHALLGMLRKELDYNWPEVDRELRIARQLNPESPLVRLRYAISGLLPHGRLDEAGVEVDAMLRTDPLSILVRWWAGIIAYLARTPGRMIEEGRRMIALDPNHFLGHWTLGSALVETGALSEAVSALVRADELSGGAPFTAGFHAYACGLAGQRDDALRLLDRLGQMAAGTYVPPSAFAMGHVGLGDWDAALGWLDKAIDARDPIVMPMRTFPFLDPVRGDARFQALLKKMRLD